MPHQTVMWYMLEGNQLLLSTPRNSLKHKHLKRDPRISVCVEKTYRYVTLTGSVTLEENPSTALADYRRLVQRYQSTFKFSPPPSGGEGGQVPELLLRERVTLHVSIDRVHSSGLD